MFALIALVISSFIYFHLNLLLLSFFDETVGSAYMDEIFHVPQAQQYCLGNYNEV
jgi:hypothetical protein